MGAARILAAVGPGATKLAGDAIRRHGDLCQAENLDDAIRLISQHRFSLVISSVDFDESRMIDLLAHCGRLPRDERMPFLCVRTMPGLLPEHTYADIRKTANFFGARYIDLTHWIDSQGLEGAINDFEGLIASLLRMRLAAQRPRSHRPGGDPAGIASATHGIELSPLTISPLPPPPNKQRPA